LQPEVDGRGVLTGRPLQEAVPIQALPAVLTDSTDEQIDEAFEVVALLGQILQVAVIQVPVGVTQEPHQGV